MDIRNKKINFLGDSITEGHGCSDVAYCFASRIARDYGAVCRNYGIGGTRIARQKSPSENPRHDLDFLGRYEAMDPDADIVAVFGGTNDFGHGDAPIGTMADRTPDTFYGALHLLYTGLITRYPSARIVVPREGGALRHARRICECHSPGGGILRPACAGPVRLLRPAAQCARHPGALRAGWPAPQ